MPAYAPLTKTDLRERIKEIESRIQQMDRREKLLGDLKKWMASRKLEVIDLQHMIKQMKPRRSSTSVKSKKPLQPEGGRWADKKKGEVPLRQPVGSGMYKHNGKLVPVKGDPEFRRAIREARIKMGLKADDIAEKIGTSGATISNWEQGRNVPRDEPRKALLKVLELPMSLGAEASAQMALGLNGKGA